MTRPPLVIVATALLGVQLGACSRHANPPPPPPVAVIDTATGQIAEYWPAPQFTYDIAEDAATGRVWAVAESETSGDLATRVLELFPDAPPTVWFKLAPHFHTTGEPEPLGRVDWLDYGAIALDPVHRRGSFTSPRSELLAMLDLDTGALVRQEGSYDLAHGTAFDVTDGVAYASGGGMVYSFRTDNGDPLQDFLCPTSFGGEIAIAVSSSSQVLYMQLGFLEICSYNPHDQSREISYVKGCYISSTQLQDCDLAGIAVDPAGERLFISRPAYSQSGPDTVTPGFTIRDLTTGAETVVDDLALPQGFAVSPDGTRLYVNEIRCQRVRAFEATTGAFLYDIPLDGDPLGIAMSADGSKLFVAQTDTHGPMGEDGARLEKVFGPCPPVVPKPAL